MDSFAKVIDKLGIETSTTPQGPMSREITKMSKQISLPSRGRTNYPKVEVIIAQ